MGSERLTVTGLTALCLKLQGWHGVHFLLKVRLGNLDAEMGKRQGRAR